jgi:hypothetical protein
MAEHEHARSQASYESAALTAELLALSADTTQGNASASPRKSDSGGGNVGQAIIARVRHLLTYDPDTGVLAWRIRRKKCRVGAPAGSLTHEGYVRVDLSGTTLQGHRIAWMITTGEMPPSRIDHINGNRADNRWCNLRAATATQNATNSDRIVQATGVWRRYGKIYSRLRHEGRVHSAGPFATEAEATAWYRATSERLRGAWEPLVSRATVPTARRRVAACLVAGLLLAGCEVRENSRPESSAAEKACRNRLAWAATRAESTAALAWENPSLVFDTPCSAIVTPERAR